MKNTVLSIVRHALTIAGGVLVAKGQLSEVTASAVIGAISAAVGMLWGAVDEYRAEHQPSAPAPTATDPDASIGEQP